MRRRRSSTGGCCLCRGVPTGASARWRLEVEPLRECASWHHHFLLHDSRGVRHRRPQRARRRFRPHPSAPPAGAKRADAERCRERAEGKGGDHDHRPADHHDRGREGYARRRQRTDEREICHTRIREQLLRQGVRHRAARDPRPPGPPGWTPDPRGGPPGRTTPAATYGDAGRRYCHNWGSRRPRSLRDAPPHRGSPRMRCAMMFACTSDVPPAMAPTRDQRNACCQRPSSTACREPATSVA